MTLLLAKKLTNAVNTATEQAGITLECDLKNFHADGERRAVGCKGEITHPTTRARVGISTTESYPNEVRISFTRNYYDDPADEVYCVPNRVAVQKIIELLTPPALSHENLSASGITNLPNLADNPLLASYLCDTATGTSQWSRGKEKLRIVIETQGFSPDDATPYPSPDADLETFQVGRALWGNLAQSCTDPHMVAHHLLAYHDVRPSETVRGRLAYYQDDKKRKAGIRTPIKVRKYLQKFFGKFRSPETLESIAKTLDEFLEDTDTYDVRTYDDSQIDGWADAYYHIASCMNTRTKAYGVGERETYRCYCTSAMTNGKKSSGLSLVVLYQGGKPVARTITYTTDDGKFYVRNYGDDRLVKWLDQHGYVCQQCLPNGTRLWTECYNSGNSEYLSPYVDGDYGEALATLELVDRQLYWVISDEGSKLQNCCGYTHGTLLTCHCCEEPIEGYEYDRTDIHGNDVTLCTHCEENHCYTVDGEADIYVDERDWDDLTATQAHGYYTQDYLDAYDLVITGDGYAMDWCDVDLCERSDEYYSKDEFVNISLEPGYVQETWAGYINDNGRVYGYFYGQLGVYIDELDTYVHKNHVDDVMAYLESERNSESASASANESESASASANESEA